MKRFVNHLIAGTFVLLFLFASYFNSNAQNTLQFNRVLKVGNISATVPAGTVWKVESALSTAPAPVRSYGIDMDHSVSSIIVDGTTVFLNRQSAGAWSDNSGYVRGFGASFSQLTPLPIWLPEGTTIAASTNVSALSVIEFIVTP